ncbi:uncharacterized protein DUF2690 [Streptomyces sp. CEV 2-1]|uniref:DUF2690 domain-containing protein n=1 Tax=Streptomyces sp. CEV 2-1 TaxID=2485153 RepID=UPI000F47BFB4|nr:DUF2690 domain-containing protein [Streptomyces sp. CEV 2-1]ROQ72533.1 uncharacterized protein DUF2690 [Streptomyces sp. CEV 2-1]
MGVERDQHANAARHELAHLLRTWWKDDPKKVTQESLARQITERGVKISQEMLSRYLKQFRPALARPDVIRAMHQVLGRPPEELAAALGLHARANVRAVQPAEPSPEGPQLQQDAPAATQETSSTDRAHPDADAAASPQGGAPVRKPVDTPAATRKRWPWAAAAIAAVVAGIVVLTAAMTDWNDNSSAKGRPPSPTASPFFAGPPSPTPTTVKCWRNTCYGVDPKYATCRKDATTYYTGKGHGIRVELRFSPSCQAAWAKMTGTTQGDIVRITSSAGDTRHYTQQWGHDAHSPMVEALNPDTAKACADTSRGRACATTPADSTPTPTPSNS